MKGNVIKSKKILSAVLFDRSNIFFTNWGCGHNFGLIYILEGQLIMAASLLVIFIIRYQ